MFILDQIFKDLFKEKTRIVLTILAIAWGTFAIASMLAIGEGLRLTFASTVTNSGNNLLNVTADKTSKTYLGLPSNANINLDKQDVYTITKLPNVLIVDPQYIFNKKFIYKSKVISKEIMAVTTNYATIHQNSVRPEGRFISLLDIQQKNAVIVLGVKTAEDFFPHGQNPVGKYIIVGNKPFLIIGVMQHKPQIVSHESPDEFSNWIPISTYELYTNPKIIDSIDIVYKESSLLPKLKQQVQETIAANHGADRSDTNIVDFTDYAKQQEQINNFFLGMQIFLGIVGALTLLVAGVGISNVMYASINRATHEIGLRMAIGAKTYQIIFHYISEALIATFFGGIIGLSLTSLLVNGLRSITFKGDLINAIGQPKPILSLLVIGIVVLILGIIGFLAGLFPALKAAKIDPTEALSYE